MPHLSRENKSVDLIGANSVGATPDIQTPDVFMFHCNQTSLKEGYFPDWELLPDPLASDDWSCIIDFAVLEGSSFLFPLHLQPSSSAGTALDWTCLQIIFGCLNFPWERNGNMRPFILSMTGYFDNHYSVFFHRGFYVQRLNLSYDVTQGLACFCTLLLKWLVTHSSCQWLASSTNFYSVFFRKVQKLHLSYDVTQYLADVRPFSQLVGHCWMPLCLLEAKSRIEERNNLLWDCIWNLQ